MVYYIQPSLASDDSVVRCLSAFYILTLAWGFRRCISVARFDLQGCAKALTRGTGRGLAPRFFLYSQTNPLLYYTRLNDRNDNYEQIRAYSHYGIV